MTRDIELKRGDLYYLITLEAERGKMHEWAEWGWEITIKNIAVYDAEDELVREYKPKGKEEEEWIEEIAGYVGQ